jgi:hypothetical protein
MAELVDFSLEGPIRRHWQFPSQWQLPITQLEKQGAAAWIVAHARSHAPRRGAPLVFPLGLSTTCLPIARMLFAPVIGLFRLACALSTTAVLLRVVNAPQSTRPHNTNDLGITPRPELAPEEDSC